ncbi:MAG: TonB-dependent receptor [Prevotella sp.]|nr:TonB-dependent receptor [Prevotella sp.]
MKKMFIFLLLAMSCQWTYAQTQTVQGTVVDAGDLPVIGATVQVTGTQLAAVTDIDGKFTIRDVPAGSSLTFSYIGMKTLTVQAAPTMNVRLEDDSKMLDEVVAIGYGTAKSKDLTSPIVVVRGEELVKVPSSQPLTALQGKVPGVNIVASGVPGAAPTVRIRGTGSFSNASPLYVVDGMLYDDIAFLNNNDIQDLSVLKDASAAAIYGVRAANGVILITTKKGLKNQPAQITYDGYIGVQKASNVLKMANSQQYATMLMEANYDAFKDPFIKSIDRFGGSYADSDFHNWTFGSNTDWYEELLRDATMTNHSIGISGGGERATYSLGMSYFDQDGIMNVENDFKRLNFRAALDYDATDWLKVGFSGVFSNSTALYGNNSAWQQAFNAPGIYPVYDETFDDSFPEKYTNPGVLGYTTNFYNPVATANYTNSKNIKKQALTNFYAQVSLIPNKLTLKTNIMYDHRSLEGRSFTPKYFVSTYQRQEKNQLNKSTTHFDDYVWDNTLNYTDKWGQHSFNAMLGYSMRETSQRYLSGTAYNVPEGQEEYWYLGQGEEGTRTVGDSGYTHRGQSYFTRLGYNYASKYYLTFTFRADGSSKYNEHWGYFPSVGASWVVSEENFLKDSKAIDYLKVRASWGRLGNDKVAASAGTRTKSNSSAVFGDIYYQGFSSSSEFSWLEWEIVNEFNAGFSLTTLRNRLNLDVDFFNRVTDHAVIAPRLPFSQTTLAGNYGKILNQGFDIAVNWSDRIGKDFKYHIGSNISILRNEVKDLGGANIIEGGKTVNIVGEEMNSYYGYKVVGIYQNQAEVDNDPIAVANKLVPGDFKYEDVNGDGKIDADDRMTLGAYIPNFTYGINLGFEWKNFDFELSTYGQAGAYLYNRKRALRYAQSDYNFDEAQYKNRWTGEGSTNTDPSAAALLKGWNVSDANKNSYFVESADYFRIQNVTLGYTFKKIKFGNYTLPSLRLHVTADRPLTLFKANTFTPEVSDSEGWDTNVYPLTSTYTFGVQIKF